MGLPVLSKTPQFLANQNFPDLGSLAADLKRMWRSGIKDTLLGNNSGWTNSSGGSIGSPTGLWQLRGNSNSSSFNMLAVGAAGPATDLITADANIVQANAGTAHSWFVVRQTGINATYEVCFDFVGAFVNSNLIITASANAGFTGGSTTNRPTATDEYQICPTTQFAPTATGVIKMHTVIASDGSYTRIFGFSANVLFMFVTIDLPQSPPSGWSNPSVACAINSTGGTATFSALNTTAAVKGLVGSTVFSAYMTGESANNVILGSFLTAANAASGNYLMAPVGIASNTASAIGKYGNFYDLWWAQSVISSGGAYPGSGTTGQFVTCGNLIIPWNQSTLLTS